MKIVRDSMIRTGANGRYLSDKKQMEKRELRGIYGAEL